MSMATYSQNSPGSMGRNSNSERTPTLSRNSPKPSAISFSVASACASHRCSETYHSETANTAGSSQAPGPDSSEIHSQDDSSSSASFSTVTSVLAQNSHIKSLPNFAFLYLPIRHQCLLLANFSNSRLAWSTAANFFVNSSRMPSLAADGSNSRRKSSLRSVNFSGNSFDCSIPLRKASINSLSHVDGLANAEPRMNPES